MEVHVFDFDGTLFFSPAPDEQFIADRYGDSMLNKLVTPFESNGLGWFQSLSTLSPPFVPEKPPVEEWFVGPVVDRLRQLGARQEKKQATSMPSLADLASGKSKKKSPGGTGSSNGASSSSPSVVIYVLTGRDEKYRKRIEGLLQQADLLRHVRYVFLKPHETAGTVRYKLDTFFQLIREHQPTAMYYYEDRLGQGGRLVTGVRLLHQALYGSDGKQVDSFWLPTGSSEVPVAQPADQLSLEDLFGSGSSKESRAIRTAHRWVAAAIGEQNRKRLGRDAKPGHSPFFTLVPGLPVIEEVSFPRPPRFTFSMLVVPPSVSTKSEKMLSTEQTVQLISVLEQERAVYDEQQKTACKKRAQSGSPCLSEGDEKPYGGGYW